MSVALAIAALKAAYPRADFPDATIKLYGAKLAGFDDAEVVAAVDRLINRCEFLPSISAIKAEIAEGQLRLPTAEEAWDIARSGSLRDAPPEVQASANAVGGRWGILKSERPETLRSQFMKDYAARRRRTVDVFVGAALPPAVPALTMGPTMASLEETTRIRPRPVMARLSRRWAGRTLEPPTDEEKRDAVEVLRLGPQSVDDDEMFDPLYREAEAIFVEAAGG